MCLQGVEQLRPSCACSLLGRDPGHQLVQEGRSLRHCSSCQNRPQLAAEKWLRKTCTNRPRTHFTSDVKTRCDNAATWSVQQCLPKCVTQLQHHTISLHAPSHTSCIPYLVAGRVDSDSAGDLAIQVSTLYNSKETLDLCKRRVVCRNQYREQ